MFAVRFLVLRASFFFFTIYTQWSEILNVAEAKEEEGAGRDNKGGTVIVITLEEAHVAMLQDMRFSADSFNNLFALEPISSLALSRVFSFGHCSSCW